MVKALVKMRIGVGGEAGKILEELKNIKDVKAGYILFGDIDMIAYVVVDNKKALCKIISQQIGKIKGVEDTDTLVIAGSFKK